MMRSRVLAMTLVSIMTALAGCAAPRPAESSPTVTAAAEPSSPLPSAAPSAALRTVRIDGSCASNQPLVMGLKNMSATSSTVVGSITVTGKRTLGKADSFDTGGSTVYNELSVKVERRFAGPEVPAEFTAYLPGGTLGNDTTEVSSVLESAWATDGRFFGTVTPSSSTAGGYAIEALPVVGSDVVFPSVGCRQPVGLPTLKSGNITVLVFDDGRLREQSGVLPAVSVSVIEDALGR